MNRKLATNARLWYDYRMKPKQVVLYARVSKDNGQETENQLVQLREYCAKQGYTIVHEYVDHMSGKRSDNRPQFQALMAAASRHEFDMVLFWRLDRFSREGVLKTLSHLQVLTSYGVGWKSYTEQYLDSLGPFRDAVLSILACIAAQERTVISERTLAGLARAKKNGRVGGRPRVVTDYTKVAELRKTGKSLGEIAAEMKLSKTTVARIAGSPAVKSWMKDTTLENLGTSYQIIGVQKPTA